jgi:hypothetical protein
MEDITLRYLGMGRRATDFTASRASFFPAGSRGSELITTISAAVTALETEGAKQDAADLDGQQATDEKDAAMAELQDLLRPINQTARGMEKLFPGIGGRFRMPRGSAQNFLNRARAYIAEATPMAAEFTSRGFPANFLTTLEATASRVESAISRQNEALAAQTAATAAVKLAQQQLVDAVHEFSPIVRNTFREDPATLAAWESASHVERPPKKAAKKKTP